MLENKYKQMTISEHISLYDKIIPKDHFLRKLKENIDFSFVNKLLEKEYSEELGRPAKEPEWKEKFPTKPEETASLEEEIKYTQELVKVIEEKITGKTDKKIKKKY